MSKSLGNTIDPIDQLNKYGIDAVRYYSLAGLSTYTNSNWNEIDLIRQWNSEICNDWGNLISRALHLIDTKCDKKIIAPDNTFLEKIKEYKDSINSLWLEFKIKEAAQKTNELVKFANKYVNDEKPWLNENYLQILSNIFYLIETVNSLYEPIIPNKYEEVKLALEGKKKQIIFNKII